MTASMTTYETEYTYAEADPITTRQIWRQNAAAAEPVIYPGLYCPSGFDIMSVLIRVMNRPNAQIELGAIDSSCAILVCDLQQDDSPIVYVSEGFSYLTGYTSPEVVGLNCRFLQAADGCVSKGSSRKYIHKDVLRKMSKSIKSNKEHQTEIVNFRKNGSAFTNILTMIPIQWDSKDFIYSVGFLCDRDG